MWKHSIILLALMASTVRGGVTNTAASMSWTDVSNACFKCNLGDSVTMPAGSADWAGATISVTNPIYIYGTGSYPNNLQSMIKNGGFYVNPLTNWFVRCSTFIQSNVDWGATYSYPNAVFGNQTMTRFDRIYFINGSHDFSVGFKGRSTSGCYGVIDHCIFTNANTANFEQQNGVGDGKDGDKAYTTAFGPLIPGTTNCWCTEDCQFYGSSVQNNTPLNNNNQNFYAEAGARFVFRHNWSGTNGSDTGLLNGGQGFTFLDNHPSVDGQFRACCIGEVYNNTNSGPYAQMIDLRGGYQLYFHDNYLTNTQSGYYIELWYENLSTDSGAVLTNAYFWNNFTNGVAYNPPYPNNATHVYAPPGALNTTYFGAAPTTGQIGFPYTPMAYPHWLVTLEDNPAATQAPPGGIVGGGGSVGAGGRAGM